jgi:AraC-like DNA-binding protein
MIITEHFPSAPLNIYINALRYCEGPAPYRHLKELPNPALNLMINLDGAFNCYKAEDPKPYATYTESWSIGLWNTHHVLDWPRNMQLFIVDFKPGGAYPFLNMPLSELHNDIVPMDAIWGNLAAEIRERLYSAPTLPARFILLEQLLLAWLDEIPDGLSAVQYALVQIDQHHGSLSIRDLAVEVGMSHNHFIRQFRQLVGGTPKEVARIYRFRYTLANLARTHPIDWGEVAWQAHYFDQSHFNKDFKAFTGHTPTDFLRLHRQVHIDHPTLPPNFLPTG